MEFSYSWAAHENDLLYIVVPPMQLPWDLNSDLIGRHLDPGAAVGGWYSGHVVLKSLQAQHV